MIFQRTQRGFIITLTLLIGFALVASAQDHTKDSLDMVKKALAAKKAVLVDVREKQEWDKGHLRNASLLPLSTLKDESKAASVLPKDKAIYLHCASGVRCVKAAEILRKEGYDVRPLKDGFKDLLKEGFPKAAD